MSGTKVSQCLQSNLNREKSLKWKQTESTIAFRSKFVKRAFLKTSPLIFIWPGHQILGNEIYTLLLKSIEDTKEKSYEYIAPSRNPDFGQLVYQLQTYSPAQGQQHAIDEALQVSI